MVAQLSEIQTDALKEMINIGMGRAALVLSEMVNSPVTLKVPTVLTLAPEEAAQEMALLGGQGRVSAVILGYKGILSGNCLLCFPPASAAKLTNFLIGEAGDYHDMDALKMATLTEVGNIMLNGVVGSISNLLEEYLRFSVPFYEEGSAQQLMQSHLSGQAEVVIIAKTSLTVKALRLVGDTVLLLEADSFATLLEAIDKVVARYTE